MYVSPREAAIPQARGSEQPITFSNLSCRRLSTLIGTAEGILESPGA
jgi:hypothetical protein